MCMLIGRGHRYFALNELYVFFYGSASDCSSVRFYPLWCGEMEGREREREQRATTVNLNPTPPRVLTAQRLEGEEKRLDWSMHVQARLHTRKSLHSSRNVFPFKWNRHFGISFKREEHQNFFFFLPLSVQLESLLMAEIFSSPSLGTQSFRTFVPSFLPLWRPKRRNSH